MSSVATAIVVSTAYSAYNNNKNARNARYAANEQARLAREAEEQRRAEAAAEAERQRQAEIRRQQNIAAGSNEIANIFGQFNDEFYNKRAQDYLNYAMPTLDREYQDEQRSLIAQLARSGNLNSSLRGDLMGKLLTQYNTNKTNLSNTANTYASDARAKVEQARAALLNSNSQLADPGVIRTMAQSQAQGINVAPQYQTLGDMIANLSGSLSAPAAQTGATTGGGVELYDPTKTGSLKIVN